ncbi:MAG: Kelch repeat-containing protein [Candidatus Polarisedimenticolia bacterium]
MIPSCFGLLTALLVLGAAPARERSLTFEQRVEAQLAIERIYYSHQEQASLPFDEAVPRELAERKVRTYLQQSAALRAAGEALGVEDLEAEAARMARETSMPERLRELHDALGDDPVLILECLVRPVLAQRRAGERLAPGIWDAERAPDGPRLDALDVGPVVTAGMQLVVPAPDESSEAASLSSGCDGGWDNGILDDFPDVTPSPEPQARSGHSTVWTGNLMIVWGGTAASSGFRYDPVLDVITAISTTGAPALSGHKAAWTGSVMIVTNGAVGGRYDPTADSWSPISSGGGTFAAASSSVWTGTELIVWGGQGQAQCSPGRPGTCSFYTNEGRRYNPATDTWQATTTVGALPPRGSHGAVWTGTHMVVWGGRACPSGLFSCNDLGGTAFLGQGLVYDPVQDSWSAFEGSGHPTGRQSHAMVWTGSEILIWGGLGFSGFVGDGGRFSFSTNSWSPMNVAGAPSPRIGPSRAWTGAEMLVWGGGAGGSTFLWTGALYHPSTDSWRPMTAVGAPPTRGIGSSVWTGSSFMFWSGLGASGAPAPRSGGRYFPPQVDGDGDGLSECANDCDDTNAAVYPGAPQICDGLNNDCEDPGWPSVPSVEADQDADGVMICAGDCDDAQATVYPGAPHLCDGVNNDCSHPAWPALGGTESDLDFDSFRVCDGDCDDANPAVRPGGAQICDGVNNDCASPGWPSLQGTNEADADQDGYSLCSGDCDLSNGSVYPGAPQLCDGVNNDCNHPAWPALGGTESDADQDGHRVCDGDCDDNNPAVDIGIPQVCDGLNNDCNHPAWPALTGTNEADDDGDGFSECALDCNDEDPGMWQPAGEALDLRLTGDTGFVWSPPAQPGAVILQYDLIRVLDERGHFVPLGQCVASDVTGTSATDAEPPYIGGIFYYLVRAQNPCGAGPAGFSSAGAETAAPSCP